MPDIKVTTKKGFLNVGQYVKKGRDITVDEFRAKELHRNGLIEDFEVKQVGEPENKQAKQPDNKAAPASAAKPKGEIKNKAE